MVHQITSDFLSLIDIKQLMDSNFKLELSQESTSKITACREYLDDKVKRSQSPIYGINTGFGSLCDTEIDKNQLSQLVDILL